MTRKGKPKLLLEGIIVPMVTPFKADEELDEEALRRFTGWLIENGVHGLFPNSSMGEFPKLSIDERKRVIDIVVDEANGRVPVLPGTGDASTKLVLELTKHAKDAGADAAVVVEPYYFKPSEEALFDHYKTINDKIEIPLVVYDIPSCTGYQIQPEMAARLADLQNVVAFKDSSGDMVKFLREIQLAGEKISLLQGIEHLLVSSLLMDAAGGILGIANACPRFVATIYETFKKGEIKEAADMQKRLNATLEVLEKFDYVLAVKQAVGLQGIQLGRVRKPGLPSERGQVETVRDCLVKLGVMK